MSTDLGAALGAVNWQANVISFLASEHTVKRIDAECAKLALWCRVIAKLHHKNPAFAFVNGLQISMQQTVTGCSLGLYQGAAASMRSMVENALYFSYFCDHAVELATLARREGYYTSKTDIIEHHKIHTPRFKELQQKLGFIGDLENWYSEISAIVHNQVPGQWINATSISTISHSPNITLEVVKMFEMAGKLINNLFLLTIAQRNWDAVESKAKTRITKGMSGEIKTLLKLDTH